MGHSSPVLEIEDSRFASVTSQSSRLRFVLESDDHHPGLLLSIFAAGTYVSMVPIHIGLRSWSVMQNSPAVTIDVLYAHSAADPRILGARRSALVYGVCFLPRVRCKIVLPVSCGIHLVLT
jgi:hypothetical protein